MGTAAAKRKEQRGNRKWGALQERAWRLKGTGAEQFGLRERLGEGEVVDAVALGSIEYAVAHLGSPLVVVLGHERCGAVSAAVAGSREPGRIATLLKAIRPAVEETKGRRGDAVDNAVCAHALDVARQLENAKPILGPAAHDGSIKVIAARYDLDSGKVSLLARTQK